MKGDRNILVIDDDSCARRESRPVTIGITEELRQIRRIRGSIRGRYAPGFENCRTNWIAAPEYIRNRSLSLGDQSVEQARALRLLSVRHQLHGDPGFLLKPLRNRPGEDIIHAGVNDDLCCEGVAKQRGENDYTEQEDWLLFEVFHSLRSSERELQTEVREKRRVLFGGFAYGVTDRHQKGNVFGEFPFAAHPEKQAMVIEATRSPASQFTYETKSPTQWLFKSDPI